MGGWFAELLSARERGVDAVNVFGGSAIGVFLAITAVSALRDPSIWTAAAMVAFGGTVGTILTAIGTGRRLRDGVPHDHPCDDDSNGAQ